MASTEVTQELDLQQLSKDLDGAAFDRDGFPGVVYRILDPKAASLVFRSGKIVCTGAESGGRVRATIIATMGALAELGVQTDESPTIEIQNLVSSADLGQPLNLNAIAVGLGLENIEYEPEQFPGLVYRMDEPSVVVLLFGSGKAVITGAKAMAEAERAIEAVRNQLIEFDLMDD